MGGQGIYIKCTQNFSRKLQGKPKCRWEDILKMGHKETGCEDLESISRIRIVISCGLLWTWYWNLGFHTG